MKGSFDLFYSGGIELDIGAWEEIVHCLVTYGDAIWVHADTAIAKRLDSPISVIVAQTFRDLADEGLIRTWELEASASELREIGTDRRTVSIDEHRDLYEHVNYTILSRPAETEESAASGADVERTSKLVEYRQELWNLGIAHLCGAQGIVYRKRPSRRLVSSTYYRYESLTKKYTKQLFKRFQIPSLALLSTDDILALRKKSAALREKVDAFVAPKLTEIEIPDRTIIEECGSVYEEYLLAVRDVVQERTGKETAKGAAKDTVIGVTGVFLPIIGIVPVAERFYNWLRKGGQRAFVLYITEVKDRALRSAVRLGE